MMVPRTIAHVGLSGLILLGGLAPTSSLCASPPVKVAGTYSSFEFNEEGGDLVGIEIRLIPTRVGLKAVVQVAEGGAGDIDLVAVTETNGEVRFDVPTPGSAPAKFKGRISVSGMAGTLSYPSGATENIVLKRTSSYWER